MENKHNKARKQQILMMSYDSSLGISLAYPAIVSILELFMLIFSITHSDVFGPYLWRYRRFYIFFLTAAVMFIAVNLFVKKDIENRYRILNIANPVFALFSFVWALAVSFSDFRITGVLDPVLFMTYSMTIPLSMFLLPFVYSVIVLSTDVVLVFIILKYTAMGLPIINYIIFFLFQFLLGTIFIRLRMRLSEKRIDEQERMTADLSMAEKIQVAMLPNVFPPFPDYDEFELYASMHAAKVVGGDFYDFSMIKDDTLAFLIADVSGKSIPGAMFMMTGKTIIQNLIHSGMSPAEVFSAANDELNKENDALLFITAWMGYLDIKTGLVHAVNAGHNPPVLIRDGKAEFVTLDPGMVLAVMGGMAYREQTIQLQKGDILYLYTDGVTEAIDPGENEYGDERLLKLLSLGKNYPEPSGKNGIAASVCELVKTDIDMFVRGADQFDDITMLCVRYLGDQ